MADTLTLDEAASLLDDAPSTDIARVEPPAEALEPFRDYSEPAPLDGDDSLPADSGRALTLEEASKLGWSDEVIEKESSPSADVPAAVIDGQPVTLRELVAGYLAAKNADLHMASVERRAAHVIAGAHGVLDASWRLATLVADRSPPPPTTDLAVINPSQYVVQKALREAVDEFIQAALEPGQDAQDIAAQVVTQRHREVLRVEFAKLVQHFPACNSEEGRKAFFDGIRTVASECGFSEDELSQVVDHRLFVLADLAREGLEARAQKKAQPPGRKRKRRRRQSSEEMERLERTGSIHDAIAVDFD